MTKQEVLEKLTELYNRCYDSSPTKDNKYSDDGWMNIAGAISTAEDVAIREIRWDEKGGDHVVKF